MDALFDRPWYTVYRVAYPTMDELKPELFEDDLDSKIAYQKKDDVETVTKEMA